MGGQGPGHKSVRAIEARLKNIQKARAARRRAPLPWRSEMESRVIEQLVWQWWVTTSDQWSVNSGRNHRAGSGGGSSAFTKAAAGKPTTAGGPWAKYKVARLLGVSHTWVSKLVKRFEANPERMRRRMAAFAPTSFEKLEQAREETRRQRERGWLRGPIRTRRVKLTLWGKKRAVTLPTKAQMRRREARNTVTSGECRVTSKQKQLLESQQSVMRVPYQELPQWAKGMLPPCGIAATGPDMSRMGKRAVPFAFRRRR